MDWDRDNKIIISSPQGENNEAECPLPFLWELKWSLTSETLGSRIMPPEAGGGQGEGAAEVLYPLAVRSPLLGKLSNNVALCNSRYILKK